MTKQSFTSASANKLLKKLADDKSMLLKQELEDCTYRCYKNEKAEIPEYDYNETRAQIKEIDSQERKIRHAIHEFNMKTTLDGTNMTIDESLILLAQMSNEHRRLAHLRMKNPITRLDTSFIRDSVEYEYANFNVKQAREDYKKLEDEIYDLQLKIDNCNQTKPFEVEF